jgi:hypothetical protein
VPLLHAKQLDAESARMPGLRISRIKGPQLEKKEKIERRRGIMGLQDSRSEGLTGWASKTKRRFLRFLSPIFLPCRA